MRIGDPTAIKTLFSTPVSRADSSSQTSPATGQRDTARLLLESRISMSVALMNTLFGLGVKEDTGAAAIKRIISGTDGNDVIKAPLGSGFNVDGGAGNDVIEGGVRQTLNGGTGNDQISARRESLINGGEGNDAIDAGAAATVGGGQGDDQIDAGFQSVVSGGDGNDTIVASGGSTIDGGSGDDSLQGWHNGVVFGGSGNDRIAMYYNGYAEGGAGDDSIDIERSVVMSFNRDGTVKRSVQNDVTVGFNRGDGRDVITLRDSEVSATIKFGDDIRADQVTLQKSGDDILITFEGSEDAITLKGASSNVKLSFQDGTSLDLADMAIADERSSGNSHLSA